jgi:hypothetical protein
MALGQTITLVDRLGNPYSSTLDPTPPGGANSLLSASSSDLPAGAVSLTNSSGNQANAAANATLAGAAAKFTWLTGFEVTGSGATTGLVVTVTVTGTIGGTLFYTYTFTAGVLLPNTPLIIEFTKPIQSSAVNTSIVVNCPASGAGGTNNAVVAHGYLL